MNENIKNRETIIKIKNNIEEMNDYHIELESEMGKCISINDSISKKDELYEIKKSNDSVISQLRVILDSSINIEE